MILVSDMTKSPCRYYKRLGEGTIEEL